MSIGHSFSQLVLLLLVFGTPFITAAIFFCYWRQRGAPLRRTLLVVSGSMFLVWTGLLVAYMAKIKPWQSGILAAGVSPQGREFVVVQTFTGFVEPYRVSLYVRDSSGVWHWNYLGHDDTAWGSTRVEFSADSFLILHKGIQVRKIPVESSVALRPDNRDGTRDLPASYSAEDVAAFHHERFG